MADFKEIGRLTIDNGDIVISELIDNGVSKGLSINKYVDTPKFTGFSKGLLIPNSKIGELSRVLSEYDLMHSALESLQ